MCVEAVYKTDDTLTNNATETLEVMLETHFKDDPASTNNAPHFRSSASREQRYLAYKSWPSWLTHISKLCSHKNQG